MRAVICLRLPSYRLLNGARMRAGACGGGGPLKIFMRRLPCETPNRSSFSFRRLAPPCPSLIAFSLDSSWSWATSKSNSFSYRNNSGSSSHELSERTNERTKMADFSGTAEYVHFTFFRKDMKRGLFITFTSQRSNLNRLYNPHFSEFRRKLWMRKKIEFIGRSWEFPLGGNGDGMLIKMKKYDKMRKEQKYEGEWRGFFGNLKRISEESGEWWSSPG